MTLDQFVTLVDIIQGSIDESALSLDEDDEEDSSSRIPTSKQGKVMKVGASEDDEEEVGFDDDGEAEELTEEEEARMVYDELKGKKAVLPLVDFLKVRYSLHMSSINLPGLYKVFSLHLLCLLDQYCAGNTPYIMIV